MRTIIARATRLALSLGQGGGLRIAVATDGATFGQRAVTLASQLQQLLGGELTGLVHILVHGRNIQWLQGLDTPICEQDILTFLPPSAGG